MSDRLKNERTPQPADVPAPDPLPLLAPPPFVAHLAAAPPDAWRELGEVLWLSLPIIITMLSFTVMSFADVLMVGRHSSEELAAVGPAVNCFFLIASLMMGTLSIINTFVSQSVSRGEKHQAPSYVWQGIYLAAAWGALAWLCRPLATGLFDWAGHEPHIKVYEVAYFKYMLLRIPPLGFWLSLSAFYQATRRPAVPMAVGLTGNVFNVLANYALIFGKWGLPEMGITGAAVATVLATYLQAALMFVIFLRHRTRMDYRSASNIGFNLARFWRVIRFGFPAGLSWTLETASWTLFLLKVVGSLGADALAANNAVSQILHLSFMPVIGLNIGVQIIVGQHVGMRDFEGAKRRTYRALALAVAFMAAMGVMFLVFRRDLIMLFCRESAGAGVVEMGSIMLIFAAVFQAFDAVGIISYGALKGAGDTVFPMIISVVCGWVIFIPLALFLVFVLKLHVVGAWLGVTVFVALIGIVTFWRFASGHWQKIDIFRGDKTTKEPALAAQEGARPLPEKPIESREAVSEGTED